MTRMSDAAAALRAAPLAALLFLTACGGDGRDEVADQGATPRAVRIEVAGVQEQLTVRRFVGRVDAVRTVDLSFRVGGLITDMPVQAGTVIAQGGLIAALDPADFELSLREAQVQADLARRDYERKQALLRQQTIPPAQFEQAEGEARLRQVALDTAKRNLGQTRLIAPFDALVTRRLVDPFTNVPPNEPVVRVQDVTELRVHINVPEDLIGLVRSPERFEVTALLPGRTEAPVLLAYREHATEPDRVTQTYQVSFGFPRAAAPDILPGMTAAVVVRVIAGETPPPVTLPVSAVSPDGNGGLQVWVFDAGTGTVSSRAIRVGPMVQDRVPVLSGLAPGDRIVTAGGHLLRDGMAVRPIDAL